MTDRRETSKTYCLTIGLQTQNIPAGIGYMVAFRLPQGFKNPDESAEFSAWSQDVQQIVMRTGETPYSSDSYEKKLSVANLMMDLADLNARYGIQIVSDGPVPAVRIRSSNPYDKEIDIDFKDQHGSFLLTEMSLSDRFRVAVSEHGRISLAEGMPEKFPFEAHATQSAHLHHRHFP